MWIATQPKWFAVTFMIGLICGFALGVSATRAETNELFFLNSLPRCTREPIISPYPAGAVSEPTTTSRNKWFAGLKPIDETTPCALQTNAGVVLCGKVVCREIEVR